MRQSLFANTGYTDLFSWYRTSFLVLLLLLSGCAARLDKASEQYYSNQPDAALATLEKGDLFGQRNRLLFLMERGVVLHELERYRESSEVLLEAARLIEDNDFISLSEQATSLVTTEWLASYKGEYSERLWVHSYQMMNYLLLYEYDDALVEARQAVDLLERFPEALNGDYFTRALIALCFANLGEDNDAYLSYRQLATDLPTVRPVAADLLYHASRLGLSDEVECYRSFLPLPSGEAELVLFVANGRVPTKRPGNVGLPLSIRFSFPYYANSMTIEPQLQVLPGPYPQLPQISSDLGQVVRQSLVERKAQIIIKETARVAAKEAISQAVGNKHGNTVEALVRIPLFLLEEPDTRSWQTLPGRLTLVRVPLPAGRHSLRLQLLADGHFPGREVELTEFEIRSGQRIFYSIRL